MRETSFNVPAVVLGVPAVQVNSIAARTVNRQLGIPPLLSGNVGIVPPGKQLDQHSPEDRQFFIFGVGGFHLWNFPPRKEVLEFLISGPRTSEPRIAVDRTAAVRWSSSPDRTAL